MNNFPNNMNSSNTFPNSTYPPYGTNDNNFNRKGFPSNTYPMNGGFNGNPTGQFNPMSSNLQYNMNKTPSMTKFPESYIPNNPIIEKIDYTNKNQLLHNNVGDNVLDETVVEYRINIDSADRDIFTYPNPFSFVVKFNPPSRNFVQQEVYVDPHNKSKGTKIHETLIKGPPKPHIEKEFRNVKYIKLENVILPQNTKIKIDENDNPTGFDPEGSLLGDRYVSLVIKELESNRTFTTGDDSTRYDEDTGKLYTPPRPFAIIIPDKILVNYYAGTPFYGSKIYKNSALGNITQLTIEFYNSMGEPIKIHELFHPHEIKQREIDNDAVPKSDLRHPLNKRLQVHLSLIIGVVEGQINNNTQLER